MACSPEKLASAAKYREAHRERLAAKQREYAAKRRPEELARVVRWQTTNPAHYRATQDAYFKGVRDEQERAAGRPRPDLCEVCGEQEQRRGRKLCFDHDHQCGHFRGWLCSRCNLALGNARDNPEILRALAAYLEAGRARRTA